MTKKETTHSRENDKTANTQLDVFLVSFHRIKVNENTADSSKLIILCLFLTSSILNIFH